NVRPDDVHMLWLIMVAMSGLLTGGLAQVTVTGLFAMGDTRTSTYLGIVTYSLYLPIKLLVFLNYGVLGLAVATSLFFAMNLIGQFYFLEKATSGSMA
ncbi:MAG: virulence factor MviN, partial [Nitrospiraceae bacterium]